jgi:hypothetical protein
MDELTTVLTLINKLSGVSFATLVVTILWGNRKRYWRWGVDFEELEARVTKEKQGILADRDWWRNIALRATGIAETHARLLNEEVVIVNEANKSILEG